MNDKDTTAIAASLTAGEQLHLRLFNRDPHAMSVTPSADSLVKKGLVKWGWDTGHVLTTTGNEVLAALTPPPTDDSGVITEMVSSLTSSEHGVHEVKGLGVFLEHEGRKKIFFEGQVVADLQRELSDLCAQLATVTQERDAYKADNATLEHEANRAESRVNFMKHNAEMHREQYRQEHDNTMMLYRALTRNTPPEIYKPVIEGLFQSTNEYDKLMSEGSRWKQRYQEATWKIEKLESALAAERQRTAKLEEERDAAIKATESQRKQKLAYLAALQIIANKTDPEKPIKLNGETDFSYGQTFGMWKVSAIARKALRESEAGE